MIVCGLFEWNQNCAICFYCLLVLVMALIIQLSRVGRGVRIAIPLISLPPPSPHVDLVWLRLMSWYVFVNDLKGEVIVRFVDIDGLGDFFLLTYNHILRHVQSDKWCLYCYVCFSSGSLLVYYYPKRHTQIYHPTHIFLDEILFLTHYYHYFKHKKHK